MKNKPDISLLYLWQLRTLYIGKLTELAVVNQGASSLLVGIESEFVLRINDHKKIATRVALIPAGAQVGLESYKGLIAMCYLDPVGEDFSALSKWMLSSCDGVLYDSVKENTQIEQLQYIKENEISPKEAYHRVISKVLPTNRNNETSTTKKAIVREIISVIKQDPLTNHGNDELADRVGMSKDQLQRSFKSITGIPIRRYRLWHRLFVTATLMASGYSLTEAALKTGFSDSSHFSHTFRSMLGMKPSSILGRKDEIKILAGGDV